jgi:2-oxoglutarate ferredoxin oxidoreductase subunit beta
MEPGVFDAAPADIAWCPGCGNFGILTIVKQALTELGKRPEETVIVSGIGQAAKLPHYLRVNFFNGLHGRALPAATAIKAANPGMTVIAESGDGDMYGEGGNHFMHAIRRNPGVVTIVHNNMVYGLTKGQASPTSPQGLVTPVQVNGVFEEPFNPLATAIALNASFVARAFSGDPDQARAILKQALAHHGFALIDLLQPCVTFNKVNTFQWFKENTYTLGQAHNPFDRQAAFATAVAPGKLALGVLYINRDRPTFEEACGAYRDTPLPLYQRSLDRAAYLNRVLDAAR